MKKKYVLFLIVIVLLACRLSWAERVLYKSGTEIEEQIVSRDKNSIWVKRSSGNVAINLNRIERIVNNDGSISKFDYSAILKSIEAQVKRGEYANAADLCGLLLESFPKSTDIRYLRALLNHKAGRLPQTEEDYKFIIENEGNNPKAYNNLGVIYATDRDSQRAKEMFAKAEEKNASIPEIHYNLAFVFLELKDYAAAITEYNTVLAKEPENVAALYNLGVAYANKGDYAAAKNQMERVLAIDKNNRDAQDALEAISEKNK